MQLNFSRILEIFFPLSEDEKVIGTYDTASFCLKRTNIHYNGVHALTAFKDTAVRSAIHLNKFHAHPHAQALLASVLTNALLELPVQPYILIPIPLSEKRMRERGYNQVANVATRALSSLAHITLKTDILRKHKHTPAQTTLSKEVRLHNLKGAFEVASREAQILAGTHVILLDDVVTTGATFDAAKSALLPHHPASIICIALAH